MLANIDRSLNVLSTFTRDEKVLLESVEDLRPATLSNPLDRSRLLTNRGRDYMDELQRQVVTFDPASRSFVTHCRACRAENRSSFSLKDTRSTL